MSNHFMPEDGKTFDRSAQLKIGLGTYNLQGDTCVHIVREALKMGYRLLDTASAYDNHKAVGEAIGDFDREKLFLVSKIWIEDEVDDADIKGSIEKALDRALKELSTPYLDLYLIHWPKHKRPLNEMLNVMHDLREKGKIRQVGVSNFTEHHLQDAYDGGIAVSWNQIEVHPYLNQSHLIAFARNHGTKTMAYRPFGKGKLMSQTPLFAEIGKRYHKSAAQVILRWFVQKGVVVIPKASSREHLLENISVFDFSLNDEEMKELDQLDEGRRYCDKEFGEFDY